MNRARNITAAVSIVCFIIAGILTFLIVKEYRTTYAEKPSTNAVELYNDTVTIRHVADMVAQGATIIYNGQEVSSIDGIDLDNCRFSYDDDNNIVYMEGDF